MTNSIRPFPVQCPAPSLCPAQRVEELMAKITWWIVPCVGVATLVWACLPTWFLWTGTGNEHLSAVAFADFNRDRRADIVLGGGGGGVSPGIVTVMDGANPAHVLFTFHG